MAAGERAVPGGDGRDPRPDRARGRQHPRRVWAGGDRALPRANGADGGHHGRADRARGRGRAAPPAGPARGLGPRRPQRPPPRVVDHPPAAAPDRRALGPHRRALHREHPLRVPAHVACRRRRRPAHRRHRRDQDRDLGLARAGLRARPPLRPQLRRELSPDAALRAGPRHQAAGDDRGGAGRHRAGAPRRGSGEGDHRVRGADLPLAARRRARQPARRQHRGVRLRRSLEPTLRPALPRRGGGCDGLRGTSARSTR